MNTRSMTKLLTGVVGLLFTFGGLSAVAQTGPGNTAIDSCKGPRDALLTLSPGSQAYRDAVQRLRDTGCGGAGGADSKCEAAQTSIETNSSRFSMESYKRAKTCWGSEDDLADLGLDDDADDSRELGGTCKEALTSSCKEENYGLAKTYRDEEKDAKERVRDIKKDLIEAKKDLAQSQREHKQKLNELNDSLEDAGKNLKKGGESLLDKLNEENAKMDDNMRQLKAQMQAQFNKWDENYVEMRDQFRAATQAVQQATYNVEVSCRVEAQQRLDETEKRIKDRTDGRIGKRYNQSSTRVAGGKKRLVTRDQKLRQMEYEKAYRRCLEGLSPGGAAAAAAVRTAKDTLERAKAKLADQQAVIENQRRQLRQAYDEATQANKQSKEQFAQKVQKLMLQQYDTYQTSLKRIERGYATENEDFQNDMNLYNERQAMTYQEMSDAQSEQYLASARLQCARANGGTVSESAGQRNLQRLEDADSTYPVLRSACRKAEVECGANHANSGFCSQITGEEVGSGSSSRSSGAR